MKLYYGIVENRQDPLTLGRCQVRIAGVHTHDKSLLDTSDLPWSVPVSPLSAAMNGIGQSPLGPVEGTTVLVFFADGERMQQPIMMGSIGGIATTPPPIDQETLDPVGANAVPTRVVLTTVEELTSGTQLTFKDYDGGVTNLTSQLTADMRVSGFGILEGTRVVSIDSNNQVTISNPVNDYGKNIITFLPAPTNLQALANTQQFLANEVPSDVPAVGESQAARPIPSSTNNEIPILPPSGSTNNQSAATEGIRALIAACDQVGLTTKEQKCALLGIVGGESAWIPKTEAYNYSLSRIKQVYRFASDADAERYSRAPSKNITREEFFSWAYGPTQRGVGFLGNETDEDGGRYYGRGFIQLTGKYNYKRYARLAREMGLNADIENNPELLNSDVNVSAIIAALYLKDRVSSDVSPTSHPNYFMAAKRAVGYNTSDIAARKLSYYEHFYGVSSGSVARTADVVTPTPPPQTDTSQPFVPQYNPETISRGAINNGFRDPNSKYPVVDYIDEPDTNRLARGIIEGTIVSLKDATRVTGLPKGVVGGTWSQPEIPFGAQYPFNHVHESESGHIHEVDDTPGQERIHTYHRSGTYTDIDANGTQVNYIVGDNYVLMERNGNIHVSGECNITTEGQVNIFVQSDANIEVSQNANIEVGNNINVNAHRDIDLTAGGNMRVNVAGDYSLTAANIFNYTAGMSKSQADSGMHLQSGDLMYVSSKAGLQLHDAERVNIESAGTLDMLSGGVTNIDYSSGHFGEGATGAGIADSIGNGLETESRKNSDGEDDWTFTPVDEGQPVNRSFDPLLGPERQFGQLSNHETPDEWDTPEGRYQSNQLRENGDPNAAAAIAGEEHTGMFGGVESTEVDTTNIQSTNRFTNDFQLSPHFTLGMMIDGGVNGRHRLVDQMLSDGNTSRLYTVQEIVSNLAALAQNVMEPALAVLPGGIDGYNNLWRINSGYRLRGVVGNESARSQHPKGQAVDIQIMGDGLADKINKNYEAVIDLEKKVAYDQLILEYRNPTSNWIHISHNPQGSRKMAFTMVNDSTYRRDANGIPAGFFKLESIPPKRG
jgi:predicted chitinase